MLGPWLIVFVGEVFGSKVVWEVSEVVWEVVVVRAVEVVIVEVFEAAAMFVRIQSI